MNIKMMRIDIITPYKKNAKKHPKEQVEHIANSIREFGWQQPLVVDKDNVLVIGHGRLLAAKRLGLKEVPVVMADQLSEQQIAALRLADNKTNESEWDFGLLDMELEDISDIDMEQFGFELTDDEEPAEIVEDEVPDDVETRCKAGDLWQLGNHRLICGDSTDKAVIDRLMDGVKARMLFTSPPYSDIREYNGGKDLSVENVARFISACRQYTDYQCVNLGIQRKKYEIVQYWDEYIKKAKDVGYKLLAWNVWDKTKCGSIGNQSAFFPIRHEWIFVFGTEFYEINTTWEKAEGSIHKGSKDRRVRQSDGTMKISKTGDLSNPLKQMESVFATLPEQGDIIKSHPATFPVALPSEYIKAMTDEKDAVMDVFGGSGSTMIACEQLNRKCYMAELDPHYCDVILQRWENFTGEKAVLIS